MTTMLPLASTVIMAAFVMLVFQRWARSRRPALLFWGIGLAMFGLGSLAELYSSIGWNPVVFRAWYGFGALLNAAWIGLGTVYLLGRPRFAHATLAVVAAGSIVGLYGVMTMPVDGAGFETSVPLSGQYKEILADGAWVRAMTPAFNIFGVVALVGGAVYSAYLFWRKKTLINRMWGNMLIAAGALVIASASTLTRFGGGEYLYVGEMVAGALMFSGFLVATRWSARSEEARGASLAQVPASGAR